MKRQVTTLRETIMSSTSVSANSGLNHIFEALALASINLSQTIRHIGLSDLIGSHGHQNKHGETQQKLDIYANELFKQALETSGVVAAVGSEEDTSFTVFKQEHLTERNHQYIVLIDPIDGSSNIDTTAPIGTIFSIYRRRQKNRDLAIDDFLQSGAYQIGAGYIIYGSSTLFVCAAGDGVHGFTLNPSTEEYLSSHPNMCFPEQATMYSINDSLHHKISGSNQKLLMHFRDPKLGLTARYTGSLVADFHRNLIRGGIYMYPAYSGADQGKLRLQYECNPLAYLAKQAGGAASNGKVDIMSIQAMDIHQRSPFYIGPKAMIEDVARILSKP